MHVWDNRFSKACAPDQRNGQAAQAARGPVYSPVRGICRNHRRCRNGGVCAVTNPQRCGPYSVDPRSHVAARNRAALFGGAGGGAIFAVVAHAAPRRCADCRRGRSALQVSGGGGGRSLGRSGGAELYRNQTSGTAGRGGGRALLADPAWRHCRFKCGARPLAHRFAALSPRSRRCPRAGRSALAAGAVSITQQAAWPLGGKP